MKQVPPSTLAAIDLGSNSFHLIVAVAEEHSFRVLDRMREPVRLAGGLDERGHLGEDAMNRAIECLTRFGERVRSLPPGSVRCVGTNTLRQARNSATFLRRAIKALGHPIDIISGYEEARLIYLGVSHDLEDDSDTRLVIDIGGGSTEFILGRRFEPLMLESLHMGCVSMSARFFPDDRITKERFRKAEIAALQEVELIRKAFRKTGWQSVIGSSGTILAVVNVLRELGLIKDGIQLWGLQQLRDFLIDKGTCNIPELQQLSNDRRPVFAGGLAILLAVFSELEIDRMRVSDSALREGLLFESLGRLHAEDTRERTVKSLISRQHIDMAQAQRIANTGELLFKQVSKAWDLGGDDSLRLLRWSALLHEVGMAVSHSQYHKHGGYLLANFDMPGFARGEQRRLAALVRGHRRKVPLDELHAFDDDTNERLLRLCVLLRLAVVLHRRRDETPLPEVQLSVDDDQVRLKFPEGWLDQHALTQADLGMEADYLKQAGLKLKIK
ncbi:MAG TPA: exopolyphosphatase [Candidatus Acidoferrum sp.]|nr:exopolyphosphatase [Candidatus Acidoferrum sp.]